MIIGFSAEACLGEALFSQDLRVGLQDKYKNANFFEIKNERFNIGYEKSGEYTTICELPPASHIYRVTPNYGYYIVFNGIFSSFNQALDSSLNSSNTFCAFDGSWRIYMGNAAGRSFSSASDAKDFAGTGGFDSSAYVIKESSGVMFSLQSIFLVLIDSGFTPQVSGVGVPVNLGEKSYRGRVEILRSSAGFLSLVNIISMDEYLYGVVPSEMPATWPAEALKAQAVAARSYAISSMKKHGKDNYDLCDMIHCQLYLGYNQEKEASNLAVKETTGVFAYYDNEPINAV